MKYQINITCIKENAPLHAVKLDPQKTYNMLHLIREFFEEHDFICDFKISYLIIMSWKLELVCEVARDFKLNAIYFWIDEEDEAK